MAIGTFTPTTNYADDATWTQAKMDAFVDGLETFLADEVTAKAPDRTGTATVTGVWTFTNANIFSGANTFSGATTFSGSTAFSANATFSARATFTGTNGIIIPHKNPTVDDSFGKTTSAPQILSLYEEELSFAQPLGIFAGQGYWFNHDELLYNAGTTLTNVGPFGLTESTSGAGAAIDTGTPISGRAGVLNLVTGTDSAGRAGLLSGLGLIGTDSNESYMLQFSLIMPASLSDGTDTYTIRIGVLDSITASPTNGLFFLYTHTASSGNWEAKSTAASTTTTTNTGVAATTNTDFHFRIHKGGSSSVAYYINNTLVATHTTNIGFAASGVGVSIIKSAGTSSRTASIDYFTMAWKCLGGRQ